MSKQEKSYSFDEYIDTFLPFMCKACMGTGRRYVWNNPRYREQIVCPDCDGTGRMDRKTIEDWREGVDSPRRLGTARLKQRASGSFN